MLHIDNVDFAKNKRQLTGTINVATLTRACELFDELSGNISYTINGDINEDNKLILKVTLCGKISTSCQNCLEKVEIPVNLENNIPIFYNESELDQALFGSDSRYDDGILAEATFDVNNFIEDEIIMSLPTAPKHDACNKLSHVDIKSHPFTVLKQLI